VLLDAFLIFIAQEKKTIPDDAHPEEKAFVDVHEILAEDVDGRILDD